MSFLNKCNNYTFKISYNTFFKFDIKINNLISLYNNYGYTAK